MVRAVVSRGKVRIANPWAVLFTNEQKQVSGNLYVSMLTKDDLHIFTGGRLANGDRLTIRVRRSNPKTHLEDWPVVEGIALHANHPVVFGPESSVMICLDHVPQRVIVDQKLAVLLEFDGMVTLPIEAPLKDWETLGTDHFHDDC